MVSVTTRVVCDPTDPGATPLVETVVVNSVPPPHVPLGVVENLIGWLLLVESP